MPATLLTAVAVAVVVVVGAAAAQDYQRPGCALRCRGNFECVHYNQFCDGYADCPAGEDEICDDSTVGPMELPKCIITESQFCNGVKDCLDGSDEAKCVSTTAPALVNLGTDWLWTWPLVGAVLCALVCTAVALSLRYMRVKRQQRRDARRRAAAERLAAESAAGGAASGGAHRRPLNLPSYTEATSTPFDGGCPNMSYCVGPADLPPDYQEALREAERQSALEKQLLQPGSGGGVPAPLLLLLPRQHAAPEEIDCRLVMLDSDGLDPPMLPHSQQLPPPAAFERGTASLSAPPSYHCKPPYGHGSAMPAAGCCAAEAPGAMAAAADAVTTPLPAHATGLSSGGPSTIPAPSYEAVISGSDGICFAAGGRPKPCSTGSSSSEVAGTHHSMC